jgi:hypothetical protein
MREAVVCGAVPGVQRHFCLELIEIAAVIATECLLVFKKSELFEPVVGADAVLEVFPEGAGQN